MFWKRLRVLLWRALLCRCPVCGEGKLYRGWFKMYEECPVCHFHYEREPGYYTGAMAANLVLSECLLVALAVPLAVNQSIPLAPAVTGGVIVAMLFPLLLYRHTKSLWMALDHLLHPVTNERIFFPE